MNIKFTFLFLFCFIYISAQETWKKTFSGESSEAIYDVIKHNNDYLMCGQTDSGLIGNQDILILKTNSNGQVIWSRQYGNKNDQVALSICLGSDNGYIVLGETQSLDTTGRDIFILKLDASGNILWSKSYESKHGEYAAQILSVSDGYFITGYTWSFTDTPDNLLFKIDLNGNIQWAKHYDSGSNENCFGATITSDNHILMIGSGAVGFSEDALFMKTNMQGEVVWAKKYGGVGSEQCNSVIEAQNGDYLIAGSTESSGAGSLDAFLVRTDTDGNQIYSRTYGTASWESAYDLDTVNSGFILTGEGYAGDYYMLLLDHNGLVTLERIFDNEKHERSFNNIVDYNNGEILITGTTSTSEMFPVSDIYMVKTNLSGADCKEELSAPTVIGTEETVVKNAGLIAKTAELMEDAIVFSAQNVVLSEDLICSKSTLYDGFSVHIPEMELFPNPLKTILNIRCNISEITKISIYNILGECKYVQWVYPKGGTHQIDLTRLKSGVYNVVLSNNQFSSSKSIIKY